MASYTVKPGDSLSLIAQAYTGDALRWGELWNENPQVSDPSVISPGVVLTLPAAWSTAVPVQKQPAAAPASVSSAVKSFFAWTRANAVYIGVGLLVVAGVLWWYGEQKPAAGRGKRRRRSRGGRPSKDGRPTTAGSKSGSHRRKRR